MSGDVVNIFGKSFYHLNSSQNPDNSYLVTNTLLSLLNSFAGSAAVTAGHSGVTGAALNGSPNVTGPLNGWLNGTAHTPPGNTPRAYINWVFLDEQFNPVTTGMSGATRVSDANNTLKPHSATVSITKNGYLYVYCSNESDVDVFFDNLQVIHTRGPLLEETHYYPFGLTMAGISSKALSFGDPGNKIKFQKQELQSNEFSDGSGLEMYQFKYRMDDPQIGRFWQINPLADKYVYNSTYAFSENKVTSHVELEGLEAVEANWNITILEDGTEEIIYDQRPTHLADVRKELGNTGILYHITNYDVVSNVFQQYDIYEPEPPKEGKKGWLPQIHIYGSGNGFSDIGSPIDYSRPILSINMANDDWAIFNLISLLGKIPTENGMTSNIGKYLSDKFPGLVNNTAKTYLDIEKSKEQNRQPPPVKLYPDKTPAKDTGNWLGTHNQLDTTNGKPDTIWFQYPPNDKRSKMYPGSTGPQR